MTDIFYGKKVALYMQSEVHTDDLYADGMKPADMDMDELGPPATVRGHQGVQGHSPRQWPVLCVRLSRFFASGATKAPSPWSSP